MSLLPKYSKLSENKRNVIRLRAEGEKLEVIAIETGVPVDTVTKWVCRDGGSLADELQEYKSHLVKKQEKSLEEFQSEIKKDAKKLWDRLILIATSEDVNMLDSVKLNALDSALDRLGLARLSKTEGKTIVSVTDADRVARFNQLREMSVDLLPDQQLLLAKTGTG